MPELLVADRKYFLHIMSHFTLWILVFFKIHEAFFSFYFLILLVFLLFFYLSLQGFYLDLNFLLGFQHVLITCSFFNFHLSKSKSHLDRISPNSLYFYFSLRIDLFNGCYLLEIRWKFSFYSLFFKCFVSISVTFEWAGVFCWPSLRQCKCY